MTDIAARTPLRTRWESGWSLLLWGLAGMLALCQAMIWYEPKTPSLAVLEQFALQLGIVALLAAVLALVLRRWARFILLAALTVTLSWPVFGHRGAPAAVTEPTRLKVVSANLWHSATGHDRMIEALLASDADIIGLIEVAPRWRPALAPLFAKYPHRADCFDRDSECQILLLSKLPIERPIVGRIWKATPIVAGGVIRWNGRPITVLATHWFRPLRRSEESPWGIDDPARSAYLADGLPVSRQTGQAGLFAKFVEREAPGNLIVMGDLNSVPWSRVQRAFRAKTGLDNQAGLATSWPSFLPWPLRLPIDHVLARGHLVVTKFEAGPPTESDHLPVIAEIGWRD